MSKQQMIEQIQQSTRGATAEFLGAFDDAALQRYLLRLTTTSGRRGPGSVWVRPVEASGRRGAGKAA